jgi:TonB family C-terminal domain
MNVTVSRPLPTAWESLPHPVPLAAVLLLHLAGLAAVWVARQPAAPTQVPTVQVRFIQPEPPPPPPPPPAPETPQPAVIAATVRTPAAIPLHKMKAPQPPALAAVPAPPVLPTPAEKTVRRRSHGRRRQRRDRRRSRPCHRALLPPISTILRRPIPPARAVAASRDRAPACDGGADGRAEQVQIARSSGFFRLDRAAARVVREQWRFEPARRGGRSIAAWVVVPIQFELE